jgi:DNA-binding transcriptional ArsR family regulator
MDDNTWKFYEVQAEVIQAAAHPLRLAIIDYLSKGEQCVCDIARHVDGQRSNVSRHLALMLNAGIVGCRKEGLKVIYSLKTPCIVNFLSCVNEVIKDKLQDNAAILEKISS